MRLIDADKFKELFNDGTSIGRIVMSFVDEQPTAYDVDKVMGRLEELNKAEQSRAEEYDEAGRLEMMDIHDAKAEAYRNSRRIVKSGGIE